jgi:hypothetical protein
MRAGFPLILWLAGALPAVCLFSAAIGRLQTRCAPTHSCRHSCSPQNCTNNLPFRAASAMRAGRSRTTRMMVR